MPTLRTCNACSRHVMADDGACPFCGEQLGLCRAPASGSLRFLLAAGLMLAGCSGTPSGAETSEVAASSGAGVTGSEVTSEATASTEASTSASDATDTSMELSGGFYAQPDMSSGPCGGPECDIWTQNDCPPGEKCTAVACASDSTAWDGDVCRPINGDKQAGDDCSGAGLDGLDECANGLLCWAEDPATQLGVCVAYCQGGPTDPQCASGTTCLIYNDGVLPLCLENCDPVAQDCRDPEKCVGPAGGVGFVCVVDGTGSAKPYGSECGGAYSCSIGLICIPAEGVPESECTGVSDCCTPFCDVNAANTCPGAGQLCEALYEPGTAPDGLDHVGVCAVPQP